MIAQSSKEDVERALQQMERAGELRRNGNQLIFLKMRPGDTAFARELYQKMVEKVENNPYQVAFEIDPKYLKSKQKAPVQVKPPITTNNQVTHVPPPSPTAATNISMPEGRYLIKLANGRVLEAESNTFKNDGAKVQIWLPYYALNQLWDLKSAGAGKYYFINVASGKTLKVNITKGIHNGSLVQTWSQSIKSEETKWFIQSAGNQKYTIRSAAAGSSNKVLDVTGGAIDRGGAAIQLWDNANAANQSWIFERSYDSAIIAPNFVDLRLNQTALKHQALGIERGSCTYFANLAALEAAYKKRGYGELDLSEEFFSIMSKVMYLEPYWSRVTTSNARENQMGATQGGGSIFWLTNGLKIPLEQNVPFRPSYTGSPLSDVQRVVNDYNATQLTDSVLTAAVYYGATTGVEFTSAQYLNPAEYEKILDLGYEISVLINGGSHNVVIIGYDKTDPANPMFLVKDSYYNPPGVACASLFDKRSYSALIASPVIGATYITAIREPASFNELAFMGRWNLNFDGHKGILDVYHIPGLNYTAKAFGGALRETDGGTIINGDNRIGVFYDEAGNAFRVNGKISGNMMEFYFDLSSPNQRWDQLLGRRFLYYINPSSKIMSGFHADAGVGLFGGYATKGTYITHAASEPYIDRLINSEWTLRWGNERGTVRCRVGEDGSVVNGTFNNGTSSRPISFRYDPADRTLIKITLGDQRAKVKFLNHESGIMCGNTDITHQPVLMYKQ